MKQSIFLLLALAFLYSCKNGAGAETKKLIPAGKEEAAAFCAQILNEAQEGNLDFFIRKVDTEAMADRGLETFKPNGKQKAACVRALPDYFQWPAEILTSMEEGGSLKLLSVKEDKGASIALFRQVGADGGLDFLEFYLAKTEGNDSVRIIDIYSFANGDFASHLAINEMIAFEKSIQETGLEHPGKGKEFKEGIEQMREILALVGEEEFDAANEEWEKLPEPFKAEKIAMKTRISIAFNRGDRSYSNALGEFSKKFPEDPSLDLLLIDKAFMDQDTHALNQLLNGIEKRLGLRDPYLDMLKMNGCFLVKDCGCADPLADAIIQAEAELDQPYWVKMRCAAAAKDYKTAIVFAQKLTELFGAEQEDFENPEDFPDLVSWYASPEYRKVFPPLPETEE